MAGAVGALPRGGTAVDLGSHWFGTGEAHEMGRPAVLDEGVLERPGGFTAAPRRRLA